MVNLLLDLTCPLKCKVTSWINAVVIHKILHLLTFWELRGNCINKKAPRGVLLPFFLFLGLIGYIIVKKLSCVKRNK